jgi:hypothetical protein
MITIGCCSLSVGALWEQVIFGSGLRGFAGLTGRAKSQWLDLRG